MAEQLFHGLKAILQIIIGECLRVAYQGSGQIRHPVIEGLRLCAEIIFLFLTIRHIFSQAAHKAGIPQTQHRIEADNLTDKLISFRRQQRLARLIQKSALTGNGVIIRQIRADAVVDPQIFIPVSAPQRCQLTETAGAGTSGPGFTECQDDL